MENENADGITIPTDVVPEIRETKGVHERYFGITDVASREHALAMANAVEQYSNDPDRRIHIGTMACHTTMNPNEDDPEGLREIFPPPEDISRPFTEHPRAFNVVHFADLYRPREVQTLYDDLEKVVEYGGEYLHAIQLDVTWPNPEELERFKAAHPDLKIILQLGKFAFQETDNDLQNIVDLLRSYGSSIDFALLDLSMGKGRSMEAGGLLPLLRLVRKEIPGLGLAVAGGLGPDSMDLLEPIAKEFPDISIDAQGRLKPADAPVDASGHMISTVPADLGRAIDYIRKSCAILDNPLT